MACHRKSGDRPSFLRRARGEDRFFLQLAAEENLFREIEIMELLRDTRILDISGVTVLEQDSSEKEAVAKDGFY